MNFKKLSGLDLIVIILLATSYSFLAYRFINTALQSTVTYSLEDVILISRSPDWKYGKGFYTAVVMLKKEGDIYNVNCKVHIGDSSYNQLVALGSVTSKEEAYSRWANVEWTDTALIIGDNAPYQVTVKRSQIERHR